MPIRYDMVTPTSHVMQFFIVGIYFRREAVTRNLFLKMKLSSKYPKIKTLRKLPAIATVVSKILQRLESFDYPINCQVH